MEDNNLDISMYGYKALLNKHEKLDDEIRCLQEEKSKNVDLLKKRFFNFLYDCFYEFKDNGISMEFEINKVEIKLMDITNEYTYWIIFTDSISGERMNYLVHALASSCNILSVYEKIQKTIIPLYKNNKKMYDRKKLLNKEIDQVKKLTNNSDKLKTKEKI